MYRSVFLRIVEEVIKNDDYFIQKRDAAKILGLSPLQKCTAAIRQLAYGTTADIQDKYIRIGESTALESLKRFCTAIYTIFEDEYLRKPNKNDIERLLTIGEQRGFPDLTEDKVPSANFIINNHEYTIGYYLADGIYPSWATLVQTISYPQGEKKKKSTRKDVERAFGVLQARFTIVQGSARLWNNNQLKIIIKACIILHNIIVEDEREDNLDHIYDHSMQSVLISHDYQSSSTFQDFCQNYIEIRDTKTHHQLRQDLIEHIWEMHGKEN